MYHIKRCLDDLQGRAGTDGAFDEKMYRYAISLEAQEPNFAEECFKVLHDEMR